MATYSYLRVSTSEQTVENQRNKIDSLGFKIDSYFEDAGISGTKSAFDRKAFKELLSVAKAGDTIVAVEISRLGRSTQDVLNLIEHLKQREIKLRIVNLDAIDLTSPTGRLMLTLMSSCAQFERELLVERTIAGLERTKNAGTILGKPPTTTPELLRKLIIEMQTKQLKDISKEYNISCNTLSKYKQKYFNNREALNEYEETYHKRLKQIELNKEK